MTCSIRALLAVCLACAGLALGGCRKPTEASVTDSEGRRFRASCREEDAPACSLEPEGGGKLPGGERVALRTASRVVSVCPIDRGDDVVDCRALVCEKDADCPPAHGVAHGTCMGGLCTDQSRSIDVTDAVVLCLSGTGLGHETPEQVERIALARHCGTPCEVPSPCRQP